MHPARLSAECDTGRKKAMFSRRTSAASHSVLVIDQKETLWNQCGYRLDDPIVGKIIGSSVGEKGGGKHQDRKHDQDGDHAAVKRSVGHVTSSA
jgi:hypothetical protein